LPKYIRRVFVAHSLMFICTAPPPHIIQAMGCCNWSFEAFQIYIRCHPSPLAALDYFGS
jgi:hypothetical protein